MGTFNPGDQKMTPLPFCQCSPFKNSRNLKFHFRICFKNFFKNYLPTPSRKMDSLKVPHLIHVIHILVFVNLSERYSKPYDFLPTTFSLLLSLAAGIILW